MSSDVDEVPNDGGFRAPMIEKADGVSHCCHAPREWRATEGAVTAGLCCTICNRILTTRANVPHIPQAERHAADCSAGNHVFHFSTGKWHCTEERKPAPIPMILHCPGVKDDGTVCGARHVDVGLFATKLHHTHSCQTCGFTWRPAVVDTVGVQFLPGFKNEAYEWERLCKSCSSGLRDAEFHEATQRGCEVCGFYGGTVMDHYLNVRAPGPELVRKGRAARGEFCLVPGALRGQAQPRTRFEELDHEPNSSAAALGRGT